MCAGILVRHEQAIRLSWCGTGGCPYTSGALAAAGRAGGGLSGGKGGTWAEMAEAEDAASGRCLHSSTSQLNLSTFRDTFMA